MYHEKFINFLGKIKGINPSLVEGIEKAHKTIFEEGFPKKENKEAELTPKSGPETLPDFKPENELERRLKGYLQ